MRQPLIFCSLLLCISNGIVIELFDILTRLLCDKRYDNSRNHACNKTGNDFINTDIRKEHKPADINNCTDNDSGNSTAEIEALPEKAEHNSRSECRTENAPCV